MERLHKHLAQAGVCSRRAAERLIEQGRVEVNGKTVTRLGSLVDPASDVVRVDGKRIGPAPGRKVYLMLNKPKGYVTTMSDPEGRPTIRDLLDDDRVRVFPVGRLDFDSEGLLLLTNDGELAQKLMHPASAVAKTYSVKVRGKPAPEALRRLSRGIVLDGRAAAVTRARCVKAAPNSWIEVTVTEGRKHVVRRMFREIGHPVLKLKRVRYAGISLGSLGSGSLRPLTGTEVDRLKSAVKPGLGASRAAAKRRSRSPGAS